MGARMGADPSSWKLGAPEIEFLPEEFAPVSSTYSAGGSCPMRARDVISQTHP